MNFCKVAVLSCTVYVVRYLFAKKIKIKFYRYENIINIYSFIDTVAFLIGKDNINNSIIY